MTETMREKVARAMCEANQYAGYWNDSHPGPDKRRWRRLARVAISAMREPSDAMLLAGHPETHKGGRTQHKAKYQAMIDTALSEGGDDG